MVLFVRFSYYKTANVFKHPKLLLAADFVKSFLLTSSPDSTSWATNCKPPSLLGFVGLHYDFQHQSLNQRSVKGNMECLDNLLSKLCEFGDGEG